MYTFFGGIDSPRERRLVIVCCRSFRAAAPRHSRKSSGRVVIDKNGSVTCADGVKCVVVEDRGIYDLILCFLIMRTMLAFDGEKVFSTLLLPRRDGIFCRHKCLEMND